MVFWLRRVKADASTVSSDEVQQVRLRRLEPLGYQRLRILHCLGGNGRPVGVYFETPTEELFRAFGCWVEKTGDHFRGISDPVYRSLVAAGRLLIGDLSAAAEILECLPQRPVERDHGAGLCLVAAAQTLSVTLPLPPELAKRPESWVAGSPEVSAVRAWLAEHREHLRWREAEGDYVLERVPALAG